MMILIMLAALVVAGLLIAVQGRRRLAKEQAAAALASARAKSRRSQVPLVSNNVKGVIATQTFQPYRPSARPDPDAEEDERAA
jgi:type II secretory pathway pseudopilin PulG